MTKQAEAQAVTEGQAGLPGGSDTEDEAPRDGAIQQAHRCAGPCKGRRGSAKTSRVLCGSRGPPASQGGKGRQGFIQRAPPARGGPQVPGRLGTQTSMEAWSNPGRSELCGLETVARVERSEATRLDGSGELRRLVPSAFSQV